MKKSIWVLGLYISLVVLLANVLSGCGLKLAQSTAGEYPAKPITVIVPYPAGGGADMIARSLDPAVQRPLKQPLVVLNMPGGASTIGMNELAGAKPDGYTIGYVAFGVILQPLYGQTRFHYPTALEPLVQINSTPIAAVVRADQPWANVNELVEYARQHPGIVKYGHSGLGSSHHVVGEMLAKEAQIDIKQVPFRGESESIAALLGGHISFALVAPSSVVEYVKSGQIKALATSGEQRLPTPEFKQVPTFSEVGYQVVLQAWQGLAAPKGLPPAIKQQLIEGLENAVHDADFQKTMADLQMPVDYLGPQQFSEKWLVDTERLAKMVKETGIAEKIASQKQ